MANVQHPDLVFEDSIENFVGIANERDDAYPWPLHNPRRRFWMFGYVRNDFADTRFNRRGARLTKRPALLGRRAKIA